MSILIKKTNLPCNQLRIYEIHSRLVLLTCTLITMQIKFLGIAALVAAVSAGPVVSTYPHRQHPLTLLISSET